MAFLFHFSPIIISTLFLMITSCIASNDDQIPKPYIVYMGSPLNSSGDSAEIAELSHLRILSSIIPSEESERISVRHSYHHAYRGFCALLTKQEATLLSGHEEVVSVFPDPMFELHTTRSWDFLGSYYSTYPYNYNDHPSSSSHDVIIGLIDTGIWPESPSFDDQHIGEIPSRWKGVCMEGFDFDKSKCNRKLIGARFYNIEDQDSSTTKLPKNTSSNTTRPNGSPRDRVGHGTHTASIAAGVFVPNASYYGLASGIARGGSPSARVATYKACPEVNNCQGSAILKAIDDAIRDGVDIISISMGRSFVFQTDFKDDPIAIGAFHAAERGVAVVCSGGNEGPDPYTVTNSAPWIFTVASSTIDRKFQSNVVLGNNVSLKGTGISIDTSGHSKTYPLAFGEDIPFHPSLTSQARNCIPGSLDAKRVAGKIIICMNDDWSISKEIKKLVVQDGKAKGLILIDEQEKSSPFDSGNFPFAEFGKLAGSKILQYINSSENPLATIFPTNEIRRFKPAPVVADTSSRGPATFTENILKPDITAPGVGILSAMIPNEDEKESSLFSITSGTSMACPHVSGTMAFIKSIHATWSFSMIKSAIMTTATISNNLRKPLTNTSNLHASPHEIDPFSPISLLSHFTPVISTPNPIVDLSCHRRPPSSSTNLPHRLASVHSRRSSSNFKMSSGDRGQTSKGSKSSKSSRKTHRRPLDSSATSSGLSSTPHTHSSPPLSYVSCGTVHPPQSSLPPFPTTSHTFIPTPGICPPRENSIYSLSDTPSLIGSSPDMAGLRLRDSSSESDSEGAFSTPPLTQSYRALTPPPLPAPAPPPAPTPAPVVESHS